MAVCYAAVTAKAPAAGGVSLSPAEQWLNKGGSRIPTPPPPPARPGLPIGVPPPPVRPVPRPVDTVVGAKTGAVSASHEVGITPAGLPKPASALPLISPSSSAMPRPRTSNMEPLPAVPKLVSAGTAAVPPLGEVLPVSASGVAAANRCGPYPKAHYKPPPPPPGDRVGVGIPSRPPPKGGEAPAPGARRLVPVQAYVEGQGGGSIYINLLTRQSQVANFARLQGQKWSLLSPWGHYRQCRAPRGFMTW